MTQAHFQIKIITESQKNTMPMDYRLHMPDLNYDL
jgi:hypothetical protein